MPSGSFIGFRVSYPNSFATSANAITYSIPISDAAGDFKSPPARINACTFCWATARRVRFSSIVVTFSEVNRCEAHKNFLCKSIRQPHLLSIVQFRQCKMKETGWFLLRACQALSPSLRPSLLHQVKAHLECSLRICTKTTSLWDRYGRTLHPF
jgi:hypothetical protein